MSTHHASTKLDWSDRHFVSKVSDGNQDEIQLAQLAAERASNPDVKSFAQKLVDDHTKMGSELTSLASTKNVKLDTDKSQGRMYKRLSKASGNDFDREFVDHMIDEHEKDIKDFEKRANDAKDPEVKSFAQAQLSTLREHLQMAQNLQSSLMPTGRDSSTSGSTDTSTSKRTTSGSSTSSDTGTTGTSTNTGSTGTDTQRGGGK
jgi:putative membrane protein